MTNQSFYLPGPKPLQSPLIPLIVLSFIPNILENPIDYTFKFIWYTMTFHHISCHSPGLNVLPGLRQHAPKCSLSLTFSPTILLWIPDTEEVAFLFLFCFVLTRYEHPISLFKTYQLLSKARVSPPKLSTRSGSCYLFELILPYLLNLCHFSYSGLLVVP